MLSLFCALALAPTKLPEPVFRLSMDGACWTRSGLTPRLRPGTTVIRVPEGTGFSFDGILSGIMLGDVPELRLTKSLTIACWVRLESYVERGPGAQIVFRGDDRSGLDPYSLSVHADGKVYFGVQNAIDQGANVSAPIPLHFWTHVMGSLDDRTGTMKLWVDGTPADGTFTKIRPLKWLDKHFAPGVSIGNIQNDQGPHNQPLNGRVADLRIYDRVVTPADIHLNLEGWDRPIR